MSESFLIYTPGEERSVAREQQKRATREKLISAAIALLSRKWLSEVSVADICRTAGMSNGVYYRYFSSKEEIFLDILEMYYQVLSEALEGVHDLGGEPAILAFCRTVYELTDRHRDLTLIFREGQYRYHDYERRINQLYEQKLGEILGHTPSAGEIIYLMAAIRFTAFRRTYHQLEVDPRMVADLLCRGVFEAGDPDWNQVFEIEVKPLPMRLQNSTPDKLIEVGKEILGRTGFHGMNIHRLTHSCDLGVGTFYNYFPSKESFMVRVIETISRQIRKFISSNLHPELSRLERELQGMVLFAFYISNVDPSCYNIVREAEFVTPDAVRRYYDDFADGYAKSVRGFRVQDPQLTGNILMGLSHYFGLAILRDPAGYRIAARKILMELSGLLQHGLNLP